MWWILPWTYFKFILIFDLLIHVARENSQQKHWHHCTKIQIWKSMAIRLDVSLEIALRREKVENASTRRHLEINWKRWQKECPSEVYARNPFCVLSLLSHAVLSCPAALKSANSIWSQRKLWLHKIWRKMKVKGGWCSETKTVIAGLHSI